MGNLERESSEVKKVKYYLAGPMSGIPQFNFPAFEAAAKDLREHGFEVKSPAEMDNDETRAAALASPDGAPGSGSANGETWGDFLARDVKIVADEVQGIIFLPGWERSRGARLEAFVGLLCGHQFLKYSPGRVDLVSKDWVSRRVINEFQK